eukprot:5678120-Ditylum_brightwellii.AAC.1
MKAALCLASVKISICQAISTGCLKLCIEIKAKKGVLRMCSEGCVMSLGEMLEEVLFQMFLMS